MRVHFAVAKSRGLGLALKLDEAATTADKAQINNYQNKETP
jgi:hypothetical protein